MRKQIIIFMLLACVGWTNAKVHIPDSVMHTDGLYVDNMKIYNDSAIFQGVNLKLDLFNSVYYAASTKGLFQSYEIALNVRLKQRFYPTLELGYAQGQLGSSSATWNGIGGWANVGLDINGLRKHINSQNALLVGIRIGTAVQQYDIDHIRLDNHYWQESQAITYPKQLRTDCWGEVVAGCQVHIYSGLMMGWYVRLKLLFTRKDSNDGTYPYYIPGYGYKDNTQWGFNYYIGWKF